MGIPLRVLVVEDSPDDMALLVLALQRAGYDPRYERVETAPAMKAALGRQSWDLVLADYFLPHFSAPSALALLKELDRDIPLVIVSGNAGEEAVVAAMKAGAQDYLAKDNLARLGPVTARVLREAEERVRRARVEEQLLGTQRFLAAIVESSADAIIGETLDGRITSWNQGAAKLFGYTPAEVLGKKVSLLAPPHRAGEMERHLEKIKLGERIEQFETERLRKDGSLLHVSRSLSPIKDAAGHMVGASAIERDMTERKRAEERFRLAVEATPNSMLLVNAQGRMAMVNSQTEALFGYRREELLGQPVEMLVPERFRGPHPGHRAAFFADPKTRAMGSGRDLFGLRKDGQEVPIEIGLNPLQTAEGMLVLASIIDITARKQAEDAVHAAKEGLELRVRERTAKLVQANNELKTEMQKRRQAQEANQRLNAELEQRVNERTCELRRSNEELQAFAYLASHDLQEPLRMVASYVQLLQKRYQGNLDAQADKYIAYAVEGAQRMQRLIHDLLLYSRAGKASETLQTVSCAAPLADALKNLKLSIEESGAQIEPQPMPVVLGDPSQLAQLFQNLIGNSLKYRGQAPPRIRITCEPHGKDWLFSISDNGIGIDPRHTSRVFRIFQRLHEPGRYSGSGVGLAIAKKIVERHGGRIWFESLPDQGATFYFTLPMAAQREHSA